MAGCNNYTSPINQLSDFFTIGPIASTMMLRDEPIMQQEQAFLVAPGAQVAMAGQLFYSLDGVNGEINLVIPEGWGWSNLRRLEIGD